MHLCALNPAKRLLFIVENVLLWTGGKKNPKKLYISKGSKGDT